MSKKEEKRIDVRDVLNSLDYYKNRVEMRKKKIEDMKEMHAPKVVIDAEEQILKRDKDNYAFNAFALRMYHQGFRDGQEALKWERLKKVLFDEGKENDNR